MVKLGNVSVASLSNAIRRTILDFAIVGDVVKVPWILKLFRSSIGYGWVDVQLSKWELVDMGSLNGTLVNSRPAGAAHKDNSTVRQRGRPTALANGDTIVLGSSSNVLVSEVCQLVSSLTSSV